jgi:hypothetical protein
MGQKLIIKLIKGLKNVQSTAEENDQIGIDNFDLEDMHQNLQRYIDELEEIGDFTFSNGDEWLD